jgi:dTMP kinase
MNRNQFITFEGPEGSGKTTIIRMLYDYLHDKGMKVLMTREPGGVEIAEQIRKVILDTNNTKMNARTEALLYAAARSQHLVEKVFPAFEEGKIVLCDRFVDSSLAYQGYARGLGVKQVMMINQFAIDGCMPGITFYLDIPPEVGLERINANSREMNRLDHESLEFHQKVKKGYREAFSYSPERVYIINANLPISDVFNKVKEIIDTKKF